MKKIEGLGFDCGSETDEIIRQRKIEKIVENIFYYFFWIVTLFIIALVLYSIQEWVASIIGY